MSSKLSTLLSTSPLTGAGLKKADGFYIFDESASGSARSKGIEVGELLKGICQDSTSTNASGETTITPQETSLQHNEETTVSGSGGTTRTIILATSTAPTAGAVVFHKVFLPATDDITLEWRDATAGGTLITSHVTDGSGDDVFAAFKFNGSAWRLLFFISPANA